MKATEIKVKDFSIGSYGIFENGKLIMADSSFVELIQNATALAGEEFDNSCNISTLKFSGTDEDSVLEEGITVMGFTNVNGVVYITNKL